MKILAYIVMTLAVIHAVSVTFISQKYGLLVVSMIIGAVGVWLLLKSKKRAPMADIVAVLKEKEQPPQAVRPIPTQMDSQKKRINRTAWIVVVGSSLLVGIALLNLSTLIDWQNAIRKNLQESRERREESRERPKYSRAMSASNVVEDYAGTRVSIGNIMRVNGSSIGLRSDGPYETYEVDGFITNTSTSIVLYVEVERDRNTGEYTVTRTKTN